MNARSDRPQAGQAIEDPYRMRGAGRDLLSLALIDARNRTLGWLTAFDGFDAAAAVDEVDPPAWIVGHLGWYQEYWIARHVQRARGESADPQARRLASIEPRADEAFDPARHSRVQRWVMPAWPAGDLRAYLAATLETTLELLERCEENDAALYGFRLALWHEDRYAETLACLAQAVGLPIERRDAGSQPSGQSMTLRLPSHPVPARVCRDALWLPSQRVRLGCEPGGYVPDNERWAHEVAVPEFEIDAQAVQWAQFVEFIDDKGYDDPSWWSDSGWAWVQAAQRRAPRYVEQASGAVLVHRRGQLQRVSANQAAMHLSWFEAEAWCRWAGRRLPTEPEWALAARAGAARGFVWGDLFEWTAGRARDWPGHAAGPARADEVPSGVARVLRGASVASVPRQHHPEARRFAAPERDEMFCGFRSCAL